MNRALALMSLVLVMAAGCGGKKAPEAPAVEEEVRGPEACPLSRIEVHPEKVYTPECVLGRACEVELRAVAYDHDGRPVEVPLHWSFRYPDFEDNDQQSGGHTLTVIDDGHARFVGGGLAPGVFSVLVEDRSCRIANGDRPQFVEGQAWVRVVSPPDADIVCGRMRVTYGDDLDRTGDIVLASTKVTIRADVSSNHKLTRTRHRVRFYINDRPYISTRPLHQSPEVRKEPDMERGYFSFLPLYLVPDQYRVRYELLENGQVICGSKTERFLAR